MKHSLKPIAFFAFIFSFLTLTYAQSGKKINHLNQSVVFDSKTLKDSQFHEGLAGTYFGKHGKYFILAGGSYFPAEKPWQGGKKTIFKNGFCI